MTEINRKAGVMWHGDSRNGRGAISTESQALFNEPYTYRTRFEEQPGTNPEELLAAAHASCFSMALASVLKKKGIDAKEIETNATCTAESKGEGFEITQMHLHVRGDVPEIDESTFHRLVMETNRICPMSKLLREGLNITIESTLMESVPQ
jgi:osmotically inducible protein OsmC